MQNSHKDHFVSAVPSEDSTTPLPANSLRDEDADYKAAVAMVRTSGRPSVSMVQRRLNVGYQYADLLFARMERDGILTAPNFRGIRDLKPSA